MEISTVHKGADNSSIKKITIGEKTFVTPAFFASISGASTRTPLGQLLGTIFAHPYSKLLVSSYDIFYYFGNDKDTIIALLNKFSELGNLVFLDSGLFEIEYRRLDDWNFEKYAEITQSVKSDLFASYDVMFRSGMSINSLISQTKEMTKKSSSLENSNQCVTICHGTRDDLFTAVQRITEDQPELSKIIAITERECGDDIIEMYHTVKKIKNIINEINPKNVLHILGCGDPISIAILTYAGADVFDAVDWGRWLIDRKSLSYYNKNQSSFLDCNCKSCQLSPMSAKEKTYKHNLTFYQDYLFALQDAIYADKSLPDFLTEYNIDQIRITKIIDFLYK